MPAIPRAPDVSTGIEAQEMQAILRVPASKAGRVGEIGLRDFKRPRRLSTARVEELAARVRLLLPNLGQTLSSSLGSPFSFELGSISEADAAPLFEFLSEPFTIARFRGNGQPAWIVWDPRAALAAVECVLGVPGAAGTESHARAMTRVEIRLLTQIMSTVAERISAALGIKPSEASMVALKEEVGSWKDAPKDAEPHRLVLELVVTNRGDPSPMLVYLPGFGARAVDARQTEAPVHDLPAYLDSVEVELCAALPGCEVPLSQLLALEVGDVIPCEVEVGGAAVVSVDGSSFARAVLGTHRGKLALRLQDSSVNGEFEG